MPLAAFPLADRAHRHIHKCGKNRLADPVSSRTFTISAGDIFATFGNAFRPSILTVVFSRCASLTAPILCSPRVASAISDRNRALPRSSAFVLLLLAIAHLQQFPRSDRCLDLLHIKLQISAGNIAQGLKLVMIDIRALALGKAVQKNRSFSAPESNH